MKYGFLTSLLNSLFSIVLIALLIKQQHEGSRFENNLLFLLLYYGIPVTAGLYFLTRFLIQRQKRVKFISGKLNLLISAGVVVLMMIIPMGNRVMINDFFFGIMQAIIFWFILSLNCFLIPGEKFTSPTE